MGVIKFDGFEGYGPDGTNAYSDTTVERRMNGRWNRLNSDYTPGSRIDTARGGLSFDMYLANGHSWTTWIGDTTSLVLGFAFRSVTAAGDLVYFRHGSSPNMTLSFNMSGQLTIKNASGSVVGTSTVVIKFRRWNYVEVKVTFSGSAGTVIVRCNGAEVLNLTGQDFEATGSHPHCDNLNWFYRDNQQMDDMYLIDQSTGGLTDFLGPIIIRRLKPSADTATADFTPSVGGDHYACVDNDRADETDYLESSTLTDDELWDYENVPSEIDVIQAISIETFIAATGVQAKKAASLCESGTSGVQEVGLCTTISPDWEQFIDVMEDDPDTSSPWTLSGFNAAQFGVRHKA